MYNKVLNKRTLKRRKKQQIIAWPSWTKKFLPTPSQDFTSFVLVCTMNWSQHTHAHPTRTEKFFSMALCPRPFIYSERSLILIFLLVTSSYNNSHCSYGFVCWKQYCSWRGKTTIHILWRLCTSLLLSSYHHFHCMTGIMAVEKKCVYQQFSHQNSSHHSVCI